MNIKNTPPGLLSRLKSFGNKARDTVSNTKNLLLAALGTLALAGCAGKSSQPGDFIPTTIPQGEIKEPQLSNYKKDFEEDMSKKGITLEIPTKISVQNNDETQDKFEKDLTNANSDELIKSISDLAEANNVDFEKLSKDSIYDFFKDLGLDPTYLNRAKTYKIITGKKYPQDGSKNKEFMKIILELIKNYRENSSKNLSKPQDNIKKEEPQSINTSPTQKDPIEKSSNEVLKLLTAQETAVVLTKKGTQSLSNGKDILSEQSVISKNKELFQKIFGIAEKLKFTEGNFEKYEAGDFQYLLFNYKGKCFQLFLPRYDDKGILEIWGKEVLKKVVDGTDVDIEKILFDEAQKLVDLYHKGDKLKLIPNKKDEDEYGKSQLSQQKPEQSVISKNKELFQKIFGVVEKLKFTEGRFEKYEVGNIQYLLFNYKGKCFQLFLPRYDNKGILDTWGKEGFKKFVDGTDADIEKILFDEAQKLVDLYHKGDKLRFIDIEDRIKQIQTKIQTLGQSVLYTTNDGIKKEADIMHFAVNDDGSIKIQIGMDKNSHNKYLDAVILEFKSFEELEKKISKIQNIEICDDVDKGGIVEKISNVSLAREIFTFAQQHINSFEISSLNGFDVLAVATFESGLNPNIKDGLMQVIPSTRRHVSNIILRKPVIKQLADMVGPKTTNNPIYSLVQGMTVLRDFESERGVNPNFIEFLGKNKESIYLAAKFHLKRRVGIEFTREQFEKIVSKILSNQEMALAYCTLKNYNGCTLRLNRNEIGGHQFTYPIAVLAISQELQNQRIPLIEFAQR